MVLQTYPIAIPKLVPTRRTVLRVMQVPRGFHEMTKGNCKRMQFVKLLFLTHNQNSRVRDALLNRMKATDTPAQCLAIAKTVESTMETEKLSKSFLQNINKPGMSEVDSVHNQKKGFKGPGCKQSGSR